jgi:hypothetical protein
MAGQLAAARLHTRRPRAPSAARMRLPGAVTEEEGRWPRAAQGAQSGMRAPATAAWSEPSGANSHHDTRQLTHYTVPCCLATAQLRRRSAGRANRHSYRRRWLPPLAPVDAGEAAALAAVGVLGVDTVPGLARCTVYWLGCGRLTSDPFKAAHAIAARAKAAVCMRAGAEPG